MQRIPIVIFNNLQLTTAVAGATSAAPDAISLRTISAATLNNTTTQAVTVDIHIVPNGGSAQPPNQIATTLSVPASGSTPTIVSALIGQTIPPGGTLQMKASTAGAVSAFVSGYQTTL